MSGDINAAAEPGTWSAQIEAIKAERDALVAEVERLNERLRLRDENRAVMLAEVEQLQAERIDDAREWSLVNEKCNQLRAERDVATEAGQALERQRDHATEVVAALRIEKQQLEARLQRSEEALVEWVAREQRLQEALRQIKELIAPNSGAAHIARAALAATDPPADE